MGAATGPSAPHGVAIDAAGRLLVANTTANSVTIFPPGANGNVAPLQSITNLIGPIGISL